MATRKTAGKKGSAALTMRDAVAAVRKAKSHFAGRKLPASWKKGGRNYEKILGHFGSRSIA